MDDDTFIFIFILMIFALGVIFGTYFVNFKLKLTIDNTLDQINTTYLGEKMCEEHGLELKNITINNYQPKFKCGNKTIEHKLEDGYLVMVD